MRTSFQYIQANYTGKHRGRYRNTVISMHINIHKYTHVYSHNLRGLKGTDNPIAISTLTPRYWLLNTIPH